MWYLEFISSNDSTNHVSILVKTGAPVNAESHDGYLS